MPVCQDRSADTLTPTAIESIVRHLVARHGLAKVRLTGGDPTSRPDLVEIIERLAAIGGLADLAMTTHGLTLGRHAPDYARAGLRRVNISLDSLDDRRFAQITGTTGLGQVIRGIDAARAAGLTTIKLNTVVMRGHNDHELPDLLRFAAQRNAGIRFIELMPMGPLAANWDAMFVDAQTMKQHLDEVVTHWQPTPRASESAQVFTVQLDDGRRGDVGFITPMSCNFCAACDRLRLTSDGGIYPCLMDQPRGSFLDALRPRFDSDRFDAILQAALRAKSPEHPGQGVAIMTTIGG
jgi:cyclic pyranopterin phosphate synthase